MAKNIPANIQNHRLLTDVEAAALLGYSPQTLETTAASAEGLAA